jgi:hypothetical protein
MHLLIFNERINKLAIAKRISYYTQYMVIRTFMPRAQGEGHLQSVFVDQPQQLSQGLGDIGQSLIV